MEVIEHRIKHGRSDKFTLYPLGDFHLGVVHCDEDLIREEVKKIKDDKNARWIGMGDYGDFISPDDFKRWEGKILADWMKGHEDNIAPTQIDRIDDILSPIWDKCLGLIEGNHEETIRRYHHVNPVQELLKRANKKNQVSYAGVQCFIRLCFDRGGHIETLIIHARHGEGSARTSGARALAVLRMSQSTINAQITLMGHLHGQESPDIPQRLLLSTKGKIKSYESIAVMTGAWIRAYMQNVPPCYLERWGCTPSVLGCPYIIVEPDKQKMELIKTRRIQNIVEL